jgi:hypothetical protein
MATGTSILVAQTTVAPSPDPHHVEWQSFQVGGMLLADPTRPDSLGRPPVVRLPEGAVLSVPVWVRGEDPEKRRTGA